MARILQDIAPRIGARVVLEPEWGVAGMIIFPSGRKRFFRFSSIDVNPLGATEVAKDKGYANYFLGYMGYSIIEGKTFYRSEFCKQIGSTDDIDAAYAYARALGFPVIVKPNSQSQGRGVALVHTKRDFYQQMRAIFKIDRVALVQRAVRGRDYRIVVLDDRVISAYERVPLNVVGNGRANIRELLQKKQREFEKAGRDTKLDFDDPRMLTKLARVGSSMDSVPQDGVRVFLLDNANLSAGGDSIEVTDDMHQDWRHMSVNITRDMGLRLCGVDLMINGNIREPLTEHWVLEINAAPGLDHYASTGRAQEKVVEDLYLEVLKSMDR